MLIWLAGADRAVLRQFPRRLRGKYAGIGAAILITGTIAGLSMWFALRTALSLPVVAAAPLALAWALAIMSIDRWLVLSLTRRDDWQGWKGTFKYLVSASPRLLLAILFGIVIATPITMEIFNSDINYQLSLAQVAHLAAEQKSAPVKSLETRVATEQSTVDSLIEEETTGSSPQVPAQYAKELTTLNSELGTAKRDAAGEFAEWQCQLYGGTLNNQPCTPGNGPLREAAQQEYEFYKQQMSSYTTQITKLNAAIAAYLAEQKAGVQDQARRQLPGASAKLLADQGELKKLQAGVVNANNANTGFFERLSALNAAVGGDFSRQAARLLLFLFFIIIDCLPVSVKIFNNIAPPDPYERALDAEENNQLEAFKATSRRRLAAEQSRSHALNRARRRTADDEVEAEEAILRHEYQQRIDAATGGGSAPRRTRSWRGFRLWWANGATQTTGQERTIIQQYDPMGPL
jgi:hypothetical protein